MCWSALAAQPAASKLTSKLFMSQPNGLALWAELRQAVRPVAAGFLRGSAVSQGLPEVGRVSRGR